MDKFNYAMQELMTMEDSAKCSLAAEYVGTNAFKFNNQVKQTAERLLRSGLESGDTLVIEGCLIGLNSMLSASLYPEHDTIESVYAVLGTTGNSNISELAYAFVNRISEMDDEG